MNFVEKSVILSYRYTAKSEASIVAARPDSNYSLMQ